MSNRNSGQTYRWLLAVVLVLIVCLLFTDQETIEDVTAQLGAWGVFFLLVFLVFTQVMAPLPAGPGILVALKLYGFEPALGLYAMASLISAAINFLLARRFGRPLVIRLAGADRIAMIDQLSGRDEYALLVIARVFGFVFFDLISYAIGLTKVGFRKYMLCTILFSMAPLSFQYIFFKDLDFQSTSGLMVFFISVFTTGAGFSWIFFRIMKLNRTPSS